MTGDDRQSLLRWYPCAWRRRYGAEVSAMIDDDLGGAVAPLRLRASLLVSGLAEHLRAVGVTGHDRPAPLRRRAGARLVLVAWAMIVVAGGAWAKFDEQWQVGTAAGQRRVADVAYACVGVSAVVGGLIVLAVAAMFVPVAVGVLRRGGWASVRRPVTAATVVLAATAASTVGLAAWAHRLAGYDRNGGLAWYSLAFALWGALVVSTVVAATVAAVRVEARLGLTPVLARVEAAAAVAVAATTVTVAAAIGTWWVSLALQSPSALSAAAAHPQVWSWPLVAVGLVAGASAALAVTGAAGITGWRARAVSTRP